MNYQSCLLCGVEGPQVRIALVEWADPEPERFSAIPRCSDVDSCRSRVAAEGEAWPLVDASSHRTPRLVHSDVSPINALQRET